MSTGRHALPYQGELGAGDVLFLCNPNNPTGEALSRQAVLELGERVARQGGILAVDEAFIDYCPECSVRDRAGDSLWVAGSLTKILAIPGARLGYLLSGQAPMAAMEALALPWALNAFAGAVAQALPDHLDQLAQEAALNRLRREQLAQALPAGGRWCSPPKPFLLADLGRDSSRPAGAGHSGAGLRLLRLESPPPAGGRAHPGGKPSPHPGPVAL